MKKVVGFVFALGLMLSLCACNEGAGGKNTGSTSGVADVIEQQMQGEESDTEAKSQLSNVSAPKAVDISYDTIDVDLTSISSTMVYSEVYNMMNAANDYVGKVVKMKGQFAAYEFTDAIYYACIIADATACCQQGLEFVLAGDYAYPGDYPAQGTEVTVTGVFELYKEGDTTYCHLTDSVMEL